MIQVKAKAGFIKNCPALTGLKSEHVDIIVSLSRIKTIQRGEYLFKANESADEFYMLSAGKVCLEIAMNGRDSKKLLNFFYYDIIGWSWIFTPSVWHFDARVVDPAQVIVFDAGNILKICQQNRDFGYEIISCFSKIMLQRMVAARMELVKAGADNAN